jgi:colicin import membrane protein
LQRKPQREPESDLDGERPNTFWRWVGIVALLHIVAISLFYLVYEFAPAPEPPPQFISLVPQGDIVKGTPGTQQAHKLGPTTAAAVHHTAPPPPSAPKPAVKTPLPKPLMPPMAERPDATRLISQNQPPKPVVKPPKPKPPKVKVDLTLADGPAQPDAPKPKHHPKKPVVKSHDEDDADSADRDSNGLSKEEIASMLGEKKDNAGEKNAEKSGTSGSADAHHSDFSEFYGMIHDQVMSQWQSPSIADESMPEPEVEFHVKKDGRVPIDSVHLTRSSGNPAYDDSAVEAVKNLGYLHEPLPDGCPPDISITFKLTR